MPEGYDKYIEEVPNVGPQYNVGLIVKDLLDHYVRVEPNRATPAQIAPLLAEFKAMANELMALSFTTPMAPLLGVPMPAQWRAALDAFYERIEKYIEAVEDAEPDDRKEILNSVTIPLFYGTEGPEGTLRGADIRTPFLLANGLMLTKQWRATWMERLWKSVKEVVVPSLPTIPEIKAWPPWAKGLAVITGIALTVWTLKTLRGR